MSDDAVTRYQALIRSWIDHHMKGCAVGETVDDVFGPLSAAWDKLSAGEQQEYRRRTRLGKFGPRLPRREGGAG